MNNKQLGIEFENRVCRVLNENGWWVHFLSPDKSGAQPFDIIAVKDGFAIAVDAKTSKSHRFSIDRLEENQKFAFEKWLRCGNSMPQVVVSYNGHMVWIAYSELKKEKVIDLRKKIVESYS